MAYISFYAIFISISMVSATPLPEIETKADADEYRLPAIYKPSSYVISLNLPAESFTNQSQAYTGTVEISFSVTEETNFTLLHSSFAYITINSLIFNNLELDVSDYKVNNVTDILTIDLTAAQGLKISRPYKLIINYTGKLSVTDMYGFYKSSYVDANNNVKYLATTQFQPTHARRAFPCFDEPSFKATFSVSLTFPKGMNGLSNTPIKSTNATDASFTTVTFEETPKMSTYLVAFIVSEFTCSQGENIEGTNVPYQVCSREEAKDTREFAVEIGSKLLKQLNEYTAYTYSINMAKMDQVAIPDFAAGAMENWGLVTYRETALLWDKNESSNAYKQRVATVIAHEFTHMWFGNLVTCNWWSETFLNEGFAALFEKFITHKVLPDWQLDKQFVTSTLQGVLESDALENAQALQSAASTPAEVSAKFGTITYNKGASILRMVEHIMGAENFQKGLQQYLAGKKNDNAVPDELWTYLKAVINATYSSLPEDLNTIMTNWVVKSGYPLLTVSRTGNTTIQISQERFLLSGEDKTSKWYVPVSYTLSTDANKFDDTYPRTWLKPDDTQPLSINITANTEWIILNNQETGYYRINYDDQLWTSISSALTKTDFDGIHELNRAQIADDVFSLAKTNKILYSKAFRIIEFLENETSYFPWYPAFNGFNYLLRRVGQSSLIGRSISKHILRLTKKLYDSVPLSKIDQENQIYTLNQVQAVTWACKLGEQDCIDNVKRIFSEFKNTTTTRPDKNLKSIVYCNALRYSNDTTDWDFLWNAYKSTDIATEQVTLLTSLGCTKNEEKLKEYLGKSISDDSDIRSQDSLSVFSAVYTGNDEGVDIAFDFLVANHKTISDKYQSMNSLGNLIKGIAERFTTEEQVNKLKSFIQTGDLSDSFKVAANEALETAQANQDWITEYKDDLMEYYEIDPDATTPNPPSGSSTEKGGGVKTSISAVLIIMSVLISKLC